MHYNPLYSEDATKSLEPRNWWHHPVVKIVCVSFFIVTIIATTLTLVLKFAILTPKPEESITTFIVPSRPVTTTISTRLTITATLIPTTKTSLETTISQTATMSTSTITATTTKQPGKLFNFCV
jgi:hypothetical protein